jgi:hypothetical protein
MHGERRAGGFEEMSTWLEQQERRVRTLEAENRELRRQLEELRRGVGISVVIEGRTVPLAPASLVTDVTAASGAVPAVQPLARDSRDPQIRPAEYRAPHPQPQPGAAPSAFGAAPAVSPPPASAPRPHPGLAPITPPAFGRSQPDGAGHTGYGHAAAGAEHRPFAPLASTPEELPPPGRLVPPSSGGWLASGDAWPDQAPARPSAPPAPIRPAGTYPPARGRIESHPLREHREPQHDERNPFADSFIL